MGPGSAAQVLQARDVCAASGLPSPFNRQRAELCAPTLTTRGAMSQQGSAQGPEPSLHWRRSVSVLFARSFIPLARTPTMFSTILGSRWSRKDEQARFLPLSCFVSGAVGKKTEGKRRPYGQSHR